MKAISRVFLKGSLSVLGPALIYMSDARADVQIAAHVGDKAVYTLSTAKNSQVTCTVGYLVTQFDSKTQRFTESVSGICSDGNSLSSTKVWSQVDLDIFFASAVNCESNGGHKEQITVPAGTYDACALPAADGIGTQWVSPTFSMGVVKLKGEVGGFMADMNLVSFTPGH